MAQDKTFFAAYDDQVCQGNTLQQVFDELVANSGDAIEIREVTFYEGVPIKVELVVKPTITRVTSSKEK